MDKGKARTLLASELENYRHRSYADLVQHLLEQPATYEVSAPSGKHHAVEIEAHWDGQKGGNLRVIGAIDDGAWRAFVPLCNSFIIASDGTFIDE